MKNENRNKIQVVQNLIQFAMNLVSRFEIRREHWPLKNYKLNISKGEG